MSTSIAAIRLVLSFNLSITVPSEEAACRVDTQHCRPTEKDRRKEEDHPCVHPAKTTLVRKEAIAHLRANIPIDDPVKRLSSVGSAVALSARFPTAAITATIAHSACTPGTSTTPLVIVSATVAQGCNPLDTSNVQTANTSWYIVAWAANSNDSIASPPTTILTLCSLFLSSHRAQAGRQSYKVHKPMSRARRFSTRTPS
jgi:hypothetical protein